MKNLTKEELFWVLYIILGDVGGVARQMHIQSGYVLLSWLNTRTPELKKQGNSLREICDLCMTGEIDSTNEISKFIFF